MPEHTVFRYAPSEIVATRFVRKIREADSGCWLWAGHVAKATGYSVVTINGRPHLAHRMAYLFFYGRLPQTPLVLDHLCRVRHCVNPTHLEAVSIAENVERGAVTPPKLNRAKTRCASGHEYTPENTYVYKGKRQCRTCRDKHNRNRPRHLRDKYNAQKMARYYARKRNVTKVGDV